ncbi:MAG: KpsF/GutQ family sugar-phosphate isomerase [Deltaproteobacteria bacterium]|uniref:KpsF/GutQ family sugar-phosphate isomerase n=1 Tax=Candidatus Zymogenus saltonus TaxID=2844893 RepID=A0A9D8KBQ5_9DELT|nr:KpsF/GutQ family sugar-phosphate isomerase [Candidatus Zymogenus saltonus]
MKGTRDTSDKVDANDRIDAIAEGKRVLKIERDAIGDLIDKIGNEFETAVRLIFDVKGRVIVTGMGKSGLVARKICATLSSTGTPAFYLHPAEGLHGDIGVVTPDDLVIALSHSGETAEVLKLFPYFRWAGVKIIGMTGEVKSTLGRESDVVLDVGVKKEACPWDIVPTSSTTAALALGDAVSVALLKMRNFDLKDFARRHPEGSIGRRIFLKVSDLMHKGEEIPVVNEDVILKDAIYEMTSKGLGMTTIIDKDGRLTGLITDGDLRRIFQKVADPLDKRVAELMVRDPKGVDEKKLAAEALRIMEDMAITSLVVRDDDGRPKGVIHIHDILRAGISL